MTHLIHRGWTIEPCEFRRDYWTATGPDYDASTDGGEGDWIDNGERVEAKGFREILSEIDAFISDTEEA